MSLVGKIKSILFEEEEIEIPIIDKKEKKEEVEENREVPKKEEVKPMTQYDSFYQDLEPTINKERKMEEKSLQNEVSEKEIFKSDNTFNFPAFDEDEFDSVIPKRTNNVVEYERKKIEKKVEYKRPERREEEKTTKPKFKPSPIISPVYGILDKNYTPDDITNRNDTISTKTLDVDSVRKKAFGSLEDDMQKREQTNNSKIEEEKMLEEKLEKARTIDELLKDSSDEVIEVPLDDSFDNNQDVLEDLEPNHVDDFEEDTLENDLFDLIDSMYENREDGE